MYISERPGPSRAPSRPVQRTQSAESTSREPLESVDASTQRLFDISQRILEVVDPRSQRDPGIQAFSDWMADVFQRVPTEMYISARQQIYNIVAEVC